MTHLVTFFSRVGKAFARHLPIVCQAVGALAIAFGIGCLLGYAWACLTTGVGLLASGTLAEMAARKPADPAKG